MPIVTASNTRVNWGTGGGSGADKNAVANVTANLSQTSIDVTPVHGSFKEFVSGIVEGTADIELFYLEADHGALAPGSLLDPFSVKLDANTSISGKAMIENYRFSAAPNGVVMATLTVRFANAAIVFS